MSMRAIRVPCQFGSIRERYSARRIVLPCARGIVRGRRGEIDAPSQVGIGRRTWPTPLGDFQVVSKEINPGWDVPLSIQQEMRREGKPIVTRVPPGPDNPLGSHWIGLSLHNIGIHGTTSPSSVYRASTHGCVRLLAAAIASLYAHVDIGARGRVIYEPVMLVHTSGGILLEAHPDIYGRGGERTIEQVGRQADLLGVMNDVDWVEAARVLRERTGIAIYVDRLKTAPLPDVPGDQGAGPVGRGSDE
jgi:L,D-transpeptidase ErfK/SrfK